MISHLFTVLKQRIDVRRKYSRALAEIEALTQSDLVEMNADRTDMRRTLYRQVYG